MLINEWVNEGVNKESECRWLTKNEWLNGGVINSEMMEREQINWQMRILRSRYCERKVSVRGLSYKSVNEKKWMDDLLTKWMNEWINVLYE